MESTKKKASESREKPKRRDRGDGGLIQIPGSRFWYLLYYHNGKQIRESSKTEVKQKAKELLRKRMADLGHGQAPAVNATRLRYADLRKLLIDDYLLRNRRSLKFDKQKRPYLSNMRHLDDFFEGWRVSAITPDAVRKFMLQEREAGRGDAAINRALSALKRMFSLATRDKKIHSAPYIELLKEPPARQGFLEYGDFKRLREALPEYLRAPFTISYFSGMRLGNVKSLEWNEVDLVAGMLRIPAGKMKNDEPISIPLNAESKSVLAAISRDGQKVFSNLGQFRKSWRNACVQCKLGKFEDVGGRKVYTGLTWHDLRRSGVRNLILAGVPQHVCMLISGHKTASVFRRYAIVVESDLRVAVDKLDAHFADQEAKVSGKSESEFGVSLVKVSPVM